MNDQAEALRNLVRGRARMEAGRTTRTVAVASGKGGVGKSNFSLNFAIALQRLGRRTLVFDADIGMANIDVLMGVASSYSLYHLLNQEKTLWDIVQEGPEGVHFIAGGSGFADLMELSPAQLEYVANQIGMLQGQYDFVLFDTGAGLSRHAVPFIEASQETVIVTTPEPTSVTDAYALIKMMLSLRAETSFRLVVNRAADPKEGRHTSDKIRLAAERFLQASVVPLGFIPDDANVPKAVRRQIPFSVAYPGCAASRATEQLARRYLELPYTDRSGGVKGFIHKLFRLS